MIDFLAKRYFLFIVSALLIASGGVAYYQHGVRYHIDFAGGIEMRLGFNEAVEISALRTAVQDSGYEDAVIQSIGSDNTAFIVGLTEQEGDVEQEFHKSVYKNLGQGFKINSIDHVGAGAGKEVRWGAFISILVSMLALLLYIAVRSKFSYAIGAIVALAHDLLALMSFILIMNIPVSLQVLAATLALLGYSLNDTIVIFGRIQENMAKNKSGDTAYNIVNRSLNETLRRTLLTSFSTLLSLLALILLGGEAIHNFALTMFVAVIVGTYSSIYIASPVALAVRGSSRA